ncbi:LacI family DNA-binding transcriptional regulator [Devosia beringensis]|uniref:LacI family DNA-binding transcriptional regulator n=1 Tax=Devosia beringensis TaxID=2657486 RepID=UPI00186B9F56|nr:LacI family DNA-binding transcriptional regulator [Devosia beringensis]
MARVTLSTIAEATGLSKFAVSRSLSGKDGVSDDTRRRVLEVATQLGYIRAVAEVAAPVLGIVFHDTDLVNSELHLLIQSGFQIETQRAGYQVRMCWAHETDEIVAFARNCRAVALVGPHPRASMVAVTALGIPVARNGWVEPLDPFDTVSGTDHEAGSAVAHYLLELGHRSIAYVHGTPGYRGRIERFYGVREVLETHPEVTFREMKFQTEMRFPQHLQEVQADGFAPTAFFCAHDGMALTVVSELLRLGYRIPDDISVVGFGDYSAATQISPQLTTVKVQGFQMGAGLVRILDDRLKQRIPADVPVRMGFVSHLVIRESAGKVRSSSPRSAAG